MPMMLFVEVERKGLAEMFKEDSVKGDRERNKEGERE